MSPRSNTWRVRGRPRDAEAAAHARAPCSTLCRPSSPCAFGAPHACPGPGAVHAQPLARRACLQVVARALAEALRDFGVDARQVARRQLLVCARETVGGCTPVRAQSRQWRRARLPARRNTATPLVFLTPGVTGADAPASAPVSAASLSPPLHQLLQAPLVESRGVDITAARGAAARHKPRESRTNAAARAGRAA